MLRLFNTVHISAKYEQYPLYTMSLRVSVYPYPSSGERLKFTNCIALPQTLCLLPIFAIIQIKINNQMFCINSI